MTQIFPTALQKEKSLSNIFGTNTIYDHILPIQKSALLR